MAEKEAMVEDHRKLRCRFRHVVDCSSRRRNEISPVARHYKKVKSPFYEDSPPTREEIEIMESCSKVDTENLEELIEEENFYLIMNWHEDESEDNEVFEETCEEYEAACGRRIPWVPVLILKLKENDKQKKRPAVVFLHGMNKNKEFLRPLLKAYASRGYIAVSMDTCYHGERATNTKAFRDALTYSWARARSKPFIHEAVYDVMRLADYLTKREDIDPSRLGITGISLGGIHAWFAAVADPRYSVVVPLIGVRGFKWAIDNDKWKGQADTMEVLFDVARHNLGKESMDKEVAEKVFNRIAPRLLTEFDAPYTLPTIAPRPLLIINGAEDPQCPIAGLEVPLSKTSEAYEMLQCSDNFKFIAEAGVGHQITRLQMKESCDWFDRFLKP